MPMLNLMIDVDRELAFSADRVWEILRDFARLDALMPAISHLHLRRHQDGLLREALCHGRPLLHQLLVRDDDERRLCYQILHAHGIGPDDGAVVCMVTRSTCKNGHCLLSWSLRLRKLPSWLPAGSEEVFNRHARAVIEENIDHLCHSLHRGGSTAEAGEEHGSCHHQ